MKSSRLNISPIDALKFQQALKVSAGSWKDENHPDLKTQSDINAFLKKARAAG